MHRCAVAATTSGRFTTPSQSAPRWQKSCGQSPRGVSAVMTSGTRSKDRVSSRVSPKSFASGVARSRSGSWGTRTRALVSDTVDGSGGVPLSNTPLDSAPLKYEIVQGALVRWSHENPEGPHPPTAVLIHGILGSRRNLLSFAKRLAQKFPSWQFVLVDLRCHGQTANMDEPPTGEHSVTSAAQDVLSTLNKCPSMAKIVRPIPQRRQCCDDLGYSFQRSRLLPCVTQIVRLGSRAVAFGFVGDTDKGVGVGYC